MAIGRATLRAVAANVAHDVAFGRLPLLLPALAVAGIFAAVLSPVAPPPWPLAGLFAALVAARVAVGRSRVAWLAGPILAVSAVVAGALALSVQERVAGTPVLQAPATVALEGRIDLVEARGDARHSLTVSVTGGDFRETAPRRVRLSVRGGEDWRVGETISLKARLFPLQGPVLPGGYDASQRLYFDGIGATGFAYGTPTRLAPPDGGLSAAVDRLRSDVEGRIDVALGEMAPFAAALLVGRRGEMPPSDVEALRVSGLGHILAISGLHMALVAGSVFAAARLALALVPLLALGAPIRKWAAVVGLLAATFYLALSGGSVATVRAYVMLAVALVAILADRPALTMRTVATAAVVVMLMDPISVTEPSFQMSFLAVIALVGAYEWWTARRVALGGGWARPFVAFVVGLAMTSLIAGLATGPAAAYHFNRLAPLTLVANLVAMPVLTLLAMPAGVIALALMPLGLEAIPLKVMGEGLEVIIAVARWAAERTGDAGLTGAVPAAAAVLSVAGLLWLAVLTAPWRLLGLLAIAAGLALAPLGPRYDVIVSETGDTVAARGPDGRLGFWGDADGFVAALWLKADGDPRAPSKELSASRCDPLGCTLPLGAGSLARSTSPRALVEDCLLAKVVVTSGVARRCPAELVVDRRTLREGGAFAAWRDGDGSWRVHVGRPYGAVRRWHVPADVVRD
ncbi:ComEC/Rec2 family competence protein [Acuticoccus sp.]|uniref:ComEC/Rec2 family competence protein n=1 Tax=Acuticoccus sp. TaxID=1904378 RepID=UPI003B51AEF1